MINPDEWTVEAHAIYELGQEIDRLEEQNKILKRMCIAACIFGILACLIGLI